MTGNISRPTGLWPRWIHEGLAVWGEGYTFNKSLNSKPRSGRPHSGIVDFYKRQYSEISKRKNIILLTPKKMDGDQLLNNVKAIDSGIIPYILGYELIQEWRTQKGSIPLFIKKSSQQLGLSYRVIARKIGQDLNKVFNIVEKRWRNTEISHSLSSSQYKKISSNKTIYGLKSQPLKNQIQWLESNSSGKTFLKIKNETTTSSYLWPDSMAGISYFYSKSEDKLITLNTHHANHKKSIWVHQDYGLRKKIHLYNKTQKKIKYHCSFHHSFFEKNKLLDFSTKNNTLALITINEKSIYSIHETTLGNDCQATPFKKVFQAPQALQRIENVSWNNDSQAWSFNISKNYNTHKDAFFDGTTNHSLTNSPMSQSFSAQEHILTQIYHPSYWGPALVSKQTGNVKLLNLSTGSWHSALNNNQVYFIEKYWDQDVLRVSSLSDFTQNSSTFQSRSHSPFKKRKVKSLKKIKKYSIFPSIIPEFWIPFISATSDGIIFTGQTQFSDLTEKWSGSLFVGFDTFLSKPTAAFGLSRSSLGLGPIKSLSTGLSYSHKYFSTINISQNRINANLHLQTHGLIFSYINWKQSFGISHQQAEKINATIPEHQITSPEFSMSLASPNGITHTSYSHKLAGSSSGFYFFQKLSWLKALEYQASLSTHYKIAKTALMLNADFAWTNIKNFPISFFSWGGTGVINTDNSGFLSRGYPVRFVDAQGVLRLAAEYAFSWGKLDMALPWNRLRLASLDTKFIYETISFDSLNPTSPYTFKGEFFGTAGLEVELWGSVLHYVPFRFAVGSYLGLNDVGGELRFALHLNASLPLN